ncbi:MAG UNVERIFIED_CONTAM: hypothetical protein LVQ98_08400 [Rickettsiaceae bacterium]
MQESFDILATKLAKSDEDKNVLTLLLAMQDGAQREDEIINFVKERLPLYTDWLLIYDNVENITEIQKYLHPDPKVWGKGKIIITSRDSNIQYNKNIHHIIQIDELDPAQQQLLFTKIIKSGNNQYLHSTENAVIIKFLEKNTPYPLDISIAAYYLKVTDIAFDQYFKHINQNDDAFDHLQSSILKQAGEYTNTRYNIIASSLDNIMKTHKDFPQLLLLVSLLDSQNISRGLLDKCKNNLIVDDFIYNLKKYSLITSETASTNGPVLSIHRAAQNIMLNYLVQKFRFKKSPSPLNRYSIYI